MKIFLGGTCNDSTWREDFIIPALKIDFFNPVVDDWTEEDYLRELHERMVCDYCLYVITPRMSGVYSIAEIIDDSNKRPEKTLFCYLVKDGELEFSPSQLKSLESVGKMVEINGAKWFRNLEELRKFLSTLAS